MLKYLSTTLLSLGILLGLNTACSQVSQTEQSQATMTPYTKLTPFTTTNQGASHSIVLKEIRDPQTGAVNQYIPLPSNWNLTQKGIEGPSGTLVQEFPGPSFTDQQRYIQSVDDLIQQDVAQILQQSGATFLRTIDLPEIARRDQRIGLQYWQAMPMEKEFVAKGIEFRDKDGKPGLLILHYNQSRTQYGRQHGYQLHVLSSSADRYEQDKKTICFALANVQSNPQVVQAFNQQMQQDHMRRQQMYEARRREAQKHFEAWNRNHVETWKEINEGTLDSYYRRQGMMDRVHERSTDAILERERLTNPYGGQPLEVQSGYKYYYTNTFGEVIGSNDEFFNPAQDPSLNHQEWRRARIGNQ
ncbi:MAG: hypothetical protein AAFV07_07165 [Bacteroidota bacterium]